MRYSLWIFSFLFFSQLAMGQEKVIQKYWITFANKSDSTFTIAQPEMFLSQRAIARRKQQNIAITLEDLPVNQSYLDSIQSLNGIILNTSKWLNAATIIADSATIAAIDTLSFVSSTAYVGQHLAPKLLLRRHGKIRDTIPKVQLLENYYGHGEQQITMLNGNYLHDAGYKGEGMLIAVLDGGFSNVDIMPFFDSLRQEGRLIYNKDFVETDSFVYESSSHGSQVLSTMAANIPGFLVGTAPQATYLCLKTEDVRHEYLIEECNWVAALEYADSLGVDVINSSLGYTVFSDANMNHVYEDLNGKTTMASRAATIASKKGMIVINSAGNDGNSKWKYIDVPADADSILSIGAIDLNKNRVGFSSIGPTADGRIKPDVVALGSRVAAASVYGPKVVRVRGTSFSSPIIAGLTASLWQAFPHKSNYEIMDAIRASAHQYQTPDNELGYGIPDFYMAFQLLKADKLKAEKGE